MHQVTERVATITGISSNNFEYAQLLYYSPCAKETDADCSFYRLHHDYIQDDEQKPQGVRALTCFIYLSDVDKGGYTVFSSGISVQPRKGRAVVWPNVLDASPNKADLRTRHEAKPVLKGEKIAANFWIHQYDFKTPHQYGC